MESDTDSHDGQVEHHGAHDNLHQCRIYIGGKILYPVLNSSHLPGASLGFMVKKPSFVTPSFCTWVTTCITSP